MTSSSTFSVKWSRRLLSILRIVAAFLLMAHGCQKLFGVPDTQHVVAIQLLSLLGVAAILEFFGGLLLLIGLFTRPVAFVLSGLMAAAYFIAHAPQGFWPMMNKGELAVMFCFVFLYMSAAGGGSWSIDRLRKKQ